MEDLKNQLKEDFIGELGCNVLKQKLDLGKNDCKNNLCVKIDFMEYNLYLLDLFLSEIRQEIIGKNKDVKKLKEVLENKNNDFRESRKILLNITEKFKSKVVQTFNQTEYLRKYDYPDKEEKNDENIRFLDNIKEGSLDQIEKYYDIGSLNKYTQNLKPNRNLNQICSNNPNQIINPSPNNYNLSTQSRISSSDQPITSTNTATLLSSKRKNKPETYFTKNCLFIKKEITNASNPKVYGLVVSQSP